MGLRSFERAAATATADDVGVFDVKAASHQIVDVVDAGAVEIEQTGRIDINPDAVLIRHFIFLLAAIFERHAILHAAATASLHEDAQPMGIEDVLFDHDLPEAVRRRFSEKNARCRIVNCHRKAYLLVCEWRDLVSTFFTG